jgi:hypothetical protein
MGEWNRTRNVRERTREHAASVIKNHIEPALGTKQPKDITEQDINRLIDSRKTQWTKIAVYKTLQGFLTHATETGIIDHNPIDQSNDPPNQGR